MHPAAGAGAPPPVACQITVHVAASDDDPVDREAVEEFAAALRTDLADLGVTRVEQVSAGEAPDGARAVELLGALQLILTVTQTAQLVGRVVRTLHRWAVRYAERRRQRLRVTVAGTPVDLAQASEQDLERLVTELLRQQGTVPAGPVGVRKALVVANGRYDDPALAQLRSPGHDADALARVLGDPAIGGFDVELLMDADERTVRRRVAELFAGRDRDDLLLLHFSCHGVKDLRGRLHLAARDTSLALLGATSVPASFVNEQMNQTQSRKVVLILDCCYSGAFARGSLVRASHAVPNEFDGGSGQVVLTASTATEYAFEGEQLTRAEGRPSVFTGALARGLQTGEADLDGDGEISIGDLYDYSYREVRARTPGQVPTKWSFGVEGRLVIARSVRPAMLPATITEDLASDRVSVRLDGIAALARLLGSDRAGLQSAARARLVEVREGDDSLRVRQAAAEALTAAASTPAASAPAEATGTPLAAGRARVATPPAAPAPTPPQPTPPTARPPPSVATLPAPIRPAPAQADGSTPGLLGMVFGIVGLGCGFLFAVPAVILGSIGLVRVSKGRATNLGQAKAGVILGVIGIVIHLALIVFLSSLL